MRVIIFNSIFKKKFRTRLDAFMILSLRKVMFFKSGGRVEQEGKLSHQLNIEKGPSTSIAVVHSHHELDYE